jgi:hypothetical protein
MNQRTGYFVRITKRGPVGEQFGWAICRQDNSLEVNRSTETFESRTEALLDSVHAAASLALPLTVDGPSASREDGVDAIKAKLHDPVFASQELRGLLRETFAANRRLRAEITQGVQEALGQLRKTQAKGRGIPSSRQVSL